MSESLRTYQVWILKQFQDSFMHGMIYKLWLVVLITPAFFGFADHEERKTTLCLNMIVKNESHVIERCLKSVKPFIDYWVIVDTGSSDDTQELIKKSLEDIPGELHEKPWVHFEHNRNEALKLAKDHSDYILIIDADEEVVWINPLDVNKLHFDAYWAKIREGDSGIDFKRILLIKNELDWRWEGIVHESLVSSGNRAEALFMNGYVLSHVSGARSQDTLKYLKDAQLLEEALQNDPDNSRYVFYLAQSYANIPEYYQLALKNYERRASMGGWDQEVFYSLYAIGFLQNLLNYPSQTVINSLVKAFLFRPSRAEPLYQIANRCLLDKDYFGAYLTASYARTIPIPEDSVFVFVWIYDWGIQLQQAESAFCLGLYKEFQNLAEELLAKKSFPSEIKEKLSKKMVLFKNQTNQTSIPISKS